MASGIYDRFKYNLMTKQVHLVNDTIKVALMNNNHSFNNTHNTWSQVSSNEITGTGYTSGGKALTNKTVTQGATTKWDADDVQWTNATFTAYHAVLYDDTLANKDLICSFDFGGAKEVVNGTFTIQWSANGIITLT